MREKERKGVRERERERERVKTAKALPTYILAVHNFIVAKI